MQQVLDRLGTLRRGICANCVNQATIAQKHAQRKSCERSQKPTKPMK
jgi:hypothetical protein